MKNIQPTYEMLEINNLTIDKYQRQPRSTQVQKIVKGFDPNRLGVITVSYRDNEYHVIDGQHRIAALQVLNIEYCMCQVHRGLTYAQECEIFYRQGDNRRGISVLEKLNARIEARDSEALELEKIVKDAGFKISKGPVKNSIQAVDALQKIMRSENGRLILMRTLSLIQNTWHGDIDSTSKKMLYGVSLFVREYYTEFKDIDFILQLEKIRPVVILREANADISTNSYNRFKIVIKKYFNKKRRGSNYLK